MLKHLFIIALLLGIAAADTFTFEVSGIIDNATYAGESSHFGYGTVQITCPVSAQPPGGGGFFGTPVAPGAATPEGDIFSSIGTVYGQLKDAFIKWLAGSMFGISDWIWFVLILLIGAIMYRENSSKG